MDNDLTIPTALDRTGSNRPTLDSLATDINDALQQQYDQRLDIAVKFAEAKGLCFEQNIPFKQWVAENIHNVGYPEAARLAKIGGAEDPKQALEDHRTKTREAVRATTAKRKSESDLAKSQSDEIETVRPTRGPQAISARVRDAINALTGLPSAKEVVGYIKGTDDESSVDEHVADAADWLADFASEWADSEWKMGDGQ